MKAMCYYIHALTALHAGTGQGVGVVDLPIAREKSTGLPIVPGSGIKGVLREELNPSNLGASDFQPCKDSEGKESEAKQCWESLFGPTSQDAEGSGFAGALNIQDAQLLCLPVRSVYGVFAWVTCPFILQRYRRDLEQVLGTSPEWQVPCGEEEQKAFATGNCKLYAKIDEKEKVFLEDLDFQLERSEQEKTEKLADSICKIIFHDDYWQTTFKERFLIVQDNIFSFLAETATEVRARIKLKQGTRTVEDGALWYEENLPAETLLWGIVGCDRSRSEKYSGTAEELMEYFLKQLDLEKSLQIGGNATVGRGRVRWIPGTERK